MENSYQGASVSLWFNECPHRCVGCWNSETWKRDERLHIDNNEVVDIVVASLGGAMNLNTLALLGGDPLSPKNISDTLYILEKVLEVRPETKVICWTGFTWEQVKRNRLLSQVLPYLDILVDGRFILDKKVEGFKYGSSNQRTIDVKVSLDSDKVVEVSI